MLTRSKARALAQQNTIVMVSPSATGEGTHTRWRYPEGHVLPAAKPATPSNLCSRSLSSFSSSSSSSSSSLSSGSSFEAPVPAPAATIPVTPQRTNRPPVTPPRLAPKKLQRSPRNCRWIEENGYTRVVLVEESFTPEAVNMRESLIQIQIDRIAEREMETLMKQRDIILEAQEMDDSDAGSFGEDCEMDLDFDSEGLEDQPVDDGSSEESYNFETSYVRGDTVEAEERDTVPAMAPPSRRLRRLGPTGTELIDPKTFTPSSSNQDSNAIYPDSWKKALRGQLDDFTTCAYTSRSKLPSPCPASFTYTSLPRCSLCPPTHMSYAVPSLMLHMLLICLDNCTYMRAVLCIEQTWTGMRSLCIECSYEQHAQTLNVIVGVVTE